MVQLFPIHINALETRQPEVFQLLGERAYEADMIVPAGLLLG
jgi:hypothetical protein